VDKIGDFEAQNTLKSSSSGLGSVPDPAGSLDLQ